MSSDTTADALKPSTVSPPAVKMVPTVPRLPSAHDRVLPALIIASLVVHATMFLPSLLRGAADKTALPPKEIPVEIVQLPPKPADKPKPPPQKPKAVAQRQAPKPPPPKPQQKPEPPKPQQAKAQPPKPQPPKPQPQQADVSERLKRLIGSMPAIALPGNSPVGGDEVSYAQLVLSKLAKAKKDGRFQHPPGATGVAFTLSDSGEVAKVEVVKSSGDKWLDDEAIEMVKRGAPYPPPPPGARRDFAITLRLQSLI